MHSISIEEILRIKGHSPVFFLRGFKGPPREREAFEVTDAAVMVTARPVGPSKKSKHRWEDTSRRAISQAMLKGIPVCSSK